ncbi:hypothetical protein EJB05_53739, partial [Eragrostis curvula]
MPTAAVPKAATTPPWADLPSDLLSEISGRFHTTSDYVHFHAVCKPWRNSIPPPARRPALLPWLLAPRDGTGYQKALCVFSSKKKPHRAAATEICFPDRRWVISVEDGRAARWLLTSSSFNYSGLGGPLNGSTGAVSLPRFQDEIKSWEESADSVASSDGTIIVYACGPIHRWNCGGFGFDVALRHPRDAEWTLVQRNNVDLYGDWCLAYRNRQIILCTLHWWRIVSTMKAEATADDTTWNRMPGEPGKVSVSSHLVESREELLLAFVQLDKDHILKEADDISNLATALSVSVYTLTEVEGGELRWVKRDVRSLSDRVLFLGRQSSFAADTARLGMSCGGCAYFVGRRKIYDGIWNKALLQCHVFKYSFVDDTAELVEHLSKEWADKGGTWITPQPNIAPTKVLLRSSYNRRK